MIPLNERGYRKGRLVADWGCPVCLRVILKAGTLDDFESIGIENNMCNECNLASRDAERRSRHLWELAQTEGYASSLYRGGVYAVRDDIAHHLRGLTTPHRLVRLYRDLKLQLPRQIIPQHDPEF